MCFQVSESGLSRSHRRRTVFMVIVQIIIFSKHRFVYSISECSNNNTYIKLLEDGTVTCATCSRCPVGYGIVSPCTRNSDSVCEQCPPHTYNDEENGECKNCTRCEVGTYAHRLCNRTIDGECRRCIDGYFSDYEDSSLCKACKLCDNNEEILSPCDRTRDTLCGNCVQDHFRDESTRGCVRCSYCHSNDSIIVRECQKKQGSSNQICLPMGYIPRNTTPPVSIIQANRTDFEDIGRHKNIILIALSTIIACVSLLFIFVLLLRSRFINTKTTEKRDMTENRSTSLLLKWQDKCHCCSDTNNFEYKFDRKGPPRKNTKHNDSFLTSSYHRDAYMVNTKSLDKHLSFSLCDEVPCEQMKICDRYYLESKLSQTRFTSAVETHLHDERKLRDNASMNKSHTDSGIDVPDTISVMTSLTGSDYNHKSNEYVYV